MSVVVIGGGPAGMIAAAEAAGAGAQTILLEQNEKLGKKLMAMGVKEEDLEAIKKAAQEEMDEAVKFADESPYPDPSEVTDDMYTADNERCVAR